MGPVSHTGPVSRMGPVSHTGPVSRMGPVSRTPPTQHARPLWICHARLVMLKTLHAWACEQHGLIRKSGLQSLAG